MENDNLHQDGSHGQAAAAAAPAGSSREQSVAPFVLGICSIIGPLFIPAVGLLVGLVCGIVGIVLSNRARQSAALDGLGQAGFIMSIVGTSLCVLVVVAGIFVVIVGLGAFGSLLGSAAYWVGF